MAVVLVSARPAEHFRTSPGGYFHGMVAKAGELNLVRTIWGLRQAKAARERAGGLQPLRPTRPAASFHARHLVSHAGTHAAAHGTAASLRHRKPEQGNMTMKNFIIATFAALSLTVAIVPAASAHSTIGGDAQATRMQQTGAYGSGG